jgi:hypothetical protein
MSSGRTAAANGRNPVFFGGLSEGWDIESEDGASVVTYIREAESRSHATEARTERVCLRNLFQAADLIPFFTSMTLRAMCPAKSAWAMAT